MIHSLYPRVILWRIPHEANVRKDRASSSRRVSLRKCRCESAGKPRIRQPSQLTGETGGGRFQQAPKSRGVAKEIESPAPGKSGVRRRWKHRKPCLRAPRRCAFRRRFRATPLTATTWTPSSPRINPGRSSPRLLCRCRNDYRYKTELLAHERRIRARRLRGHHHPFSGAPDLTIDTPSRPVRSIKSRWGISRVQGSVVRHQRLLRLK